MVPQKCIIDNWSLEHASILVNSDLELRFGKQNPESYLGGLSNFIDAVLLYEEVFLDILGSTFVLLRLWI